MSVRSRCGSPASTRALLAAATPCRLRTMYHYTDGSVAPPQPSLRLSLQCQLPLRGGAKELLSLQALSITVRLMSCGGLESEESQ